MKAYLLINIEIVILLVLHNTIFGMELFERNLLQIDYLMQKEIRYEHHQKNFLRSLEEGITPTGLKIKTKPGILPISEGFQETWNSILLTTEQHLVELLLKESNNIITDIQIQIQASLAK